jgi:Acyl-CoA dehydrogenase, N-terminal domain/Acyl-CoA dehydrogenase, middle domain
MATADALLKPDHGAHRKHFIFTDEHHQLRESIHSFVTKELAPHADEWEETTFPDSVFTRMGELGFLGLSYPEEYGGQGGDYYCNLVLAEEMVHSNCGGLAMGVAVHTDMATPPVHLFGTEEQKQAYLVPSIRGEKISCLGITEPDAGSDVSGIKTRAIRDGDDWVINGSKTYITNGHRADYIVLVAKTDPDAGYDGFTLFLVDMDTPGVIREKRLEKLGMHASDTALLAFQDVRVPAEADRYGRVRGRGAEVLRQDAPVRQRAHGVRAPDRPLPGDPPQVRRHGDQDRGRPPDGLHDGMALRGRRVSRARDLDGKALHRADGVRGDRRVPPDPRRRRLHEGVRHRARVARHAPEPYRRRNRRGDAGRDRPLVRALGALRLRAVLAIRPHHFAVSAHHLAFSARHS